MTSISNTANQHIEENKSDVDIKIDIITPLKDAYYRNNRTSGQKSLRCFPDCCTGKGHEVHAFCGRSFVCNATLLLNSLENHESFTEIVEEVLIYHMLEMKSLPSCWVGKIPTFIMQIRPENEAYLLSSSVINEATLCKYLRDGNNNAAHNFRKDGIASDIIGLGVEECYSGIITKMKRFYCDKFDRLELEIVFNFKLASWDYSWKSNRWSCDTLHAVDIIAYNKIEDEKMLHLVTYASSSFFQIVGTKVSRTAQDKDKGKKAMTGNSELIVPSNNTEATANLSKHVTDLPLHFDESEKQLLKKMRIENEKPIHIDEEKQLKNIMHDSMRDIYAVIKGDTERGIIEPTKVDTKNVNENNKKEKKTTIVPRMVMRDGNKDQMIIGEMTEKKILKLLQNHDNDKNIYEIFSTVKGWIPSVRYKDNSSKGMVHPSKSDESYALPPYHVPRITASKEFVYDNLRLYQSLHSTTYGINPMLIPQAPKLPTDIIVFPQKYRQSNVDEAKKAKSSMNNKLY